MEYQVRASGEEKNATVWPCQLPVMERATESSCTVMRHGDPFASCDGVMDTRGALSLQCAAGTGRSVAAPNARTLRSVL